jgi:hypothetical protein
MLNDDSEPQQKSNQSAPRQSLVQLLAQLPKGDHHRIPGVSKKLPELVFYQTRPMYHFKDSKSTDNTDLGFKNNLE